MTSVIKKTPLAFREEPGDPFIIRMYHLDKYPAGDNMAIPLEEISEDRVIRNDFDLDRDFRLYHGEDIPGFPAHPHRGFETITFVIEGTIDHFDSQGASGRYSKGDVQWMTAGKGIQHSEMFPLLKEDDNNPLELFQIWLNLPREDKFVEPEYKMLWAEDIPVYRDQRLSLHLIAGSYGDLVAPEPTRNSWARKKDANLSIYYLEMEGDSKFFLNSVSPSLNRNLYFIDGDSLEIDGKVYSGQLSFKLDGNKETVIVNRGGPSRLLLMEGEPIGEPMVNMGPFVMTNQEEILEAKKDFWRTEFGGWPWSSREPVNPKTSPRFAKYKS